MTAKSKTVLFICSGNSGRSIMAEAILNSLSNGRFLAFSAGSHPTGRINPFTINELRRRGYPTAGLTSKSWHKFTEPASIELDFVITVCAKAAAERQPNWPGSPNKLQWAFDAPGAVAGSHQVVTQAFESVCGEIEAAVKEFILIN